MKKKNAEVQSRRDFFKKAAKAALPILGIAVLASNPVVAKAAETATGCSRDNCSYTCATSCYKNCYGTCDTTCKGGCKGGCYNGCYQGCNTSAKKY